ncbi:MAG: type II toxin-antitoxin system VapC family toxin [Bryobacteraceae bacterium]
MVIDTSAVLAILLDEPERRSFNERIQADSRRLISAGTLLECAIVMESRGGEAAGRELDLFLHRASFDVVAVDADQAEIARAAYRRYGKGRHAAGLNFGDCFAYALAKANGEPLLYKGADFARTDVIPSLCR